MRPVSLRTSALLLTLIMVLMPMTPFADQNFESSDIKPETNETLNEQIVLTAGGTGNADSIAFGYSPDVLSVQLVASSAGVTVATDNSVLATPKT